MPLAKDYTDKRFGTLVAIGPTEKRRGSGVVWAFQCDCGDTRLAVPNDLIQSMKQNNNTPRCLGCNPKKELPGYRANKNRVLENYKRHARDRNIEFNLSDLESEMLFMSNCFYCESPPSNKRLHRQYEKAFIYNRGYRDRRKR